MPFKIATWNINSVRLRIGLVEQFLEEHQPDVLCLQEIKCQNDQFPSKNFKKMGYEYMAVHGQKGYHGVATVSKRPLSESYSKDYVSMGDTRHISAQVEAGGRKLQIHNFYVPAGGDEADVVKNPKFDHKLKFLTEMLELPHDHSGVENILVGDLNIAPHENDVWSHKKMLKVVSHTPIETEGLEAVRAKGRWIDTQRFLIPEPEELFTWWSYRSPNWEAANKGRRLDHIWATEHLDGTIAKTKVLKHARSWERPSDHAPVLTEFEF